MRKLNFVLPWLLTFVTCLIVVSCSPPEPTPPPEPPPCPSTSESDYFWRVERGLSNILDHADRIQYWGQHEDFYPDPFNDPGYYSQVEFHHQGIIGESNKLTSLNAPASAKLVENLVAKLARVAITRAEGSLKAEPGPDGLFHLTLTSGAYHQRTAFLISIQEVIDNWCP